MPKERFHRFIVPAVTFTSILQISDVGEEYFLLLALKSDGEAKRAKAARPRLRMDCFFHLTISFSSYESAFIQKQGFCRALKRGTFSKCPSYGSQFTIEVRLFLHSLLSPSHSSDSGDLGNNFLSPLYHRQFR